jgi:hypothetical protein
MRHARRVDAVLHRIEALAGTGRYAVTFRRTDGSEQTAVVEADDDDVTVAEASLPAGWTRTSAAWQATAAAVLAVHLARDTGPQRSVLRDVDGGWDVGLGNVVLGEGGAPTCIAHGEMTAAAGVWICAECGARAQLG